MSGTHPSATPPRLVSVAGRVPAWICAALALLAWTSAAGAQRPPRRLRPGERVRIWAPAAGMRGDTLTLLRSGPSALRVRRKGVERDLRRDEIERIEARVRTGSHAGLGALIGAGVGGLLFAGAVGWCSDPDIVCGSGDYVTAFGLLVLPPTLAGGLVGLLIPRRGWAPVPAGPPLRAPRTRRGALSGGLGFSVGFPLP